MTGLGKQSKVLSDTQLRRLLEFVKTETRFPERNEVIVQLSFRAGLRAKEIAGLTWAMVMDEGVIGGKDDELEVRNVASKGKRGGRRIPMNPELKKSLEVLYELERAISGSTQARASERGTANSYVVTLSKGIGDLTSRAASVAFLMNGKGVQQGWMAKLGFEGATSHSGRRTFITKASRMVSSVGGSLRDVMELAGHSSLQMTARYTDENADAKRKLVGKM